MIETKKHLPISLRSALRWLSLILVSAFLGVSLYTWNAQRLLNNAMPMPFGYGLSVVLSGSMSPTLQVDDLVLIHQTQDVSVGDIIVYQQNNSLIIHRVISRDGDTLVTQGDANNTADQPIHISQVKGRYVFRIPYMGRLMWALRTPQGVIALLSATLLAMEFSYRHECARQEDDLSDLREEVHHLRRERRGEESSHEKKS
jgi:signal peptidase